MIAFRKAHVESVFKAVEREVGLVDSTRNEPGFSAMPRSQALIRVIRMTAVPAVHHLLRALPPRITEDAAKRLDTFIFNTVINMVGLKEAVPQEVTAKGQRVRARFAIGKEAGGLAMASAVRVGRVAYLAAAVRTAQYMRWVGFDGDVETSLAAADQLFHAEAAHANSPLYRAGTLVDAAVAGLKTTRLQAALTDAADKRTAKAAYHAAGDDEKVVIKANQGAGGGWLEANPRFLKIPDSVVSDAVAMRLHIRADGGAGGEETIKCARCNADQPSTGEHAHLCKFQAGFQQRAGEASRAFGGAIAQMKNLRIIGGNQKGGMQPFQPAYCTDLSEIGLVETDAEKRRRASAKNEKARAADAAVRTADGILYALDFVVVANHSAATRGPYLKYNSDRGSAAKYAENTKHNSYSKVFSNYEAKQHAVKMCATEVHGACGGTYNQLIKDLVDHNRPLRHGYDIDGLRSRDITQFRQRISIGIIMGNHRVLADWRQHSVRAPVVGAV